VHESEIPALIQCAKRLKGCWRGIVSRVCSLWPTPIKKIGPQGIDAATRIVGFFVSAMGVGLIFHGAVEFLQSYGVLLNGVAK